MVTPAAWRVFILDWFITPHSTFDVERSMFEVHLFMYLTSNAQLPTSNTVTPTPWLVKVKLVQFSTFDVQRWAFDVQRSILHFLLSLFVDHSFNTSTSGTPTDPEGGLISRQVAMVAAMS